MLPFQGARRIVGGWVNRIDPDFGYGTVKPFIHILAGDPADEVEIVPARLLAGGNHDLEDAFGALWRIDKFNLRGVWKRELRAEFDL